MPDWAQKISEPITIWENGLYAVCTYLLNDEVSDILKVSEGRWEIEECFRIMKTDFSARPVYLQDENNSEKQQRKRIKY